MIDFLVLDYCVRVEEIRSGNLLVILPALFALAAFPPHSAQLPDFRDNVLRKFVSRILLLL